MARTLQLHLRIAWATTLDSFSHDCLCYCWYQQQIMTILPWALALCLFSQLSKRTLSLWREQLAFDSFPDHMRIFASMFRTEATTQPRTLRQRRSMQLASPQTKAFARHPQLLIAVGFDQEGIAADLASTAPELENPTTMPSRLDPFENDGTMQIGLERQYRQSTGFEARTRISPDLSLPAF
jgi:hypothetical protein